MPSVAIFLQYHLSFLVLCIMLSSLGCENKLNQNRCLILKFKLIYFCGPLCVSVHVYQGMHMEVRGQLKKQKKWSSPSPIHVLLS